MNLIPFRNTSEPVKIDATLEAILSILSGYGKPGIMMLDVGGWHAYCYMNTTVLGANFEIRSEFNHSTAISAAKECLDRVTAAVGGEE